MRSRGERADRVAKISSFSFHPCLEAEGLRVSVYNPNHPSKRWFTATIAKQTGAGNLNVIGDEVGEQHVIDPVLREIELLDLGEQKIHTCYIYICIYIYPLSTY